MEQTTTPNYGVVTEQGDMGLGFSVLTESEQKTVETSERRQRDVGDSDK